MIKKIIYLLLFLITIIALSLLIKKTMNLNNCINFERKIILQDSTFIELTYLNLKTFKNIKEKFKWDKMNDLLSKYDSPIYVNEYGNILDECIYGPKGVVFKNIDDFKLFKRSMNFIYIQRQDKLILSEKINKNHFDKLMNEFRIVKAKSDYSEDLFLIKANHKVIEYRDVDKMGWIYDTINDFNTMAIEYGLKNIYITFPVEKKSPADAAPKNWPKLN